MRTIKLMADYQCFPLWENSPEVVGNIDPGDLPISAKLSEELLAWADEFDATLNLSDPASSGFGSAEAKAVFKQRGIELAERLAQELGSEFAVIVGS